MSSANTTHDPVSAPASSLAGLRREIDAIDDALHDLLMRRAGVVQRVAGLTEAGKIPYRPGREADVIARLLARHTGPLARRAIVRWWREIYAAHIGIETAFTISVCEPAGPGGEYAAVAREHFGALTPLRLNPNAADVIDDVVTGRATAGVLPMPTEAAWWPALLGPARIVGRLPYWASRPEGAPTVEAFVIAAAPADPGPDDRTVMSAGPDASVGFAGSAVIARSGDATLIEIPGRIGDDDARLGGCTVLGHYAVPVSA